MPATKYLIGQIFSRLTVVSRLTELKHGQQVWGCNCECGNSVEVITSSLTRGHTQSCGCLQKDKINRNPHENLLRRKFGFLTVTSYEGEGKWKCLCKCGNLSKVRGSHLLNGRTLSCGCYRSASLSGDKSKFWKGGIAAEGRRLRHTAPYFKWSKMIKARDKFTCQRCQTTLLNSLLDAHHILACRQYPELSLEMSNGVTLCRACHKKLHKIYGKSSNEKQLQIFMESQLEVFGKITVSNK